LVVRLAEAERTGDALDLACGLGRHTLWLAGHGWRVTAVDYSKVALEILRERADGLPLRIVRADLETAGLPLRPECYDLICDCNFLWRPLFPEICRALRPGGLFVGVFPLAGQAGNRTPSNPDYLIQPGELERVFDGWGIVHSGEGRSSASGRARAEIAARRPA
jgi:SAM-dependent methyltransferase